MPDTTGAVLADILDDLSSRVRGQIENADQDELYWQADPGGNSCGATVWHFTRWLDVISVRLLDNLSSENEIWIADGWAERTGYDPRGLGEGGLGVLTGYTIEQVLQMPRLSSMELLAYHQEVVSRLRPQLLDLPLAHLATESPGHDVMTARAAVTGPRNTYGWIKLMLIGSLQHVGEIAAIRAMRQRMLRA